MGLIKNLFGGGGELIGETYGEAVGEEKADKLLIPWFGRRERVIELYRREYGAAGREYGEGAGVVAEICRDLFGGGNDDYDDYDE